MKQNLTIFLLLLFAGNSQAQTWTGAISGDWFMAANWSPATAPTGSSTVIIPGSLSTYPTLTANVVVAGLTMASGSSLHLAGYTFVDSGNVSLTSATVDGGGAFTVINPASVSIGSSTLATAATVINYRGAFAFLDNTITGNVVLKDSSIQATSSNYIDGNNITGDLTVTHASASDLMYEGLSGTTGDIVSGNATFTLSGAGGFSGAHTHGITVGGNLIINRTASGQTNFGNGSTPNLISGNFSISTVGGNTGLNVNNTSPISINGTLSVSATSTGAFQMFRVKNAAAGGTVSIINPASLNLQNDTIKATVNISDYTGAANIWDNSFTGNTSISDAASQANGTNYIDGNLFTGNLNLTHASASDQMLMGFSSPSTNGNRVTGNASITLSGAGGFYNANNHGFIVGGSLTVARTVSGPTYLFTSGTSSVGGAFSYTTVGGASIINALSNPVVPVGGSFSINAPTASLFHMYRMKNSVGGGTVSVAGSNDLDLRNDSLTADVSLSGYTGGCYIWDNSFAGSTSISDAAAQNNGTNYIDGNLFTGSLTLTHNSASDQMLEGYASPSGNNDRVTGNAIFNLAGAGAFLSSYDHGLRVNGNLTVNRTAAGLTNLFINASSAGSVGGNFSFTSSGGNCYLNQNNTLLTQVGGTFNISASAAGVFHMYRMQNGIAGGTVSVAGSNNLDLRNDSLIATLSITGYTGGCYIWDNSFTGAATIADAAAQNTGTNYIDGNLFTSSLALTHNSASDDMYEGYGSPSGNGNHVIGNGTLTVAGAGRIFSSYDHGLRVDGNLTVNRTASGNTDLFRNNITTGSVGGNFSYTTIGGDSYINALNTVTTLVNGTFNVSAPAAGVFRMYKMKNLTSGGTVAVNGATYLDVQRDTIKALVNLTGFVNQSYIWDNAFTGNVSIADAAAQNSSSNYVDGNLIAGNLAITHNSASDQMSEGYGSPTSNPNHVTGDATFIVAGAGSFYGSYDHGIKADGNLSLTRQTGGLTNLFRSNAGQANIAGNLTINIPYDNNTFINDGNTANVIVGGTLNVATTGTGVFHMAHIKNSITGGAINVSGASQVVMLADTLMASLTVAGYTSICNIWDNTINGNVTISDDILQNSGSNYVDGNLISGNLTLVHNSASDQMTEGYGSPTGLPNHVLGNTTFTLGAGPFASGYNHGLRVDGNMIVVRNVAGSSNTTLFYNNSIPGSIGGNFSITASNSNNFYVNDGSAVNLPVGGTINVAAPLAGQFRMSHIKNLTAGGTVDVSGATYLDVRLDTLLANVRLTRYNGPAFILDNRFTGNTLISDSTTQSTGSNYIDGNRFVGNFTLVHNSTSDVMYDGYSSPSGNGNVVTGIDSIVKATGANAMQISYNHTHEADGDFVLNAPASGAIIPSLAFGGSTSGHLRQKGAQFPSIPNVLLNKTGGAKLFLDTALGITSNLTFTSGYIVASAAHALVFSNASTYSGAGSSSHVQGQIIKAGSQAFTFPLGSGVNYSPAGITAPASAADTFSAEYIHASPTPAGYNTASHDASVTTVSGIEYWLVNRAASTTSNVKVTLGFNASSGVTSPSVLRVAHWFNNGTSTSWHDEGNGGTTGTSSSGTIQSNNTISSFSPFTLAAISGTPLGVNLRSFEAAKEGNKASITWQSNDETGLKAYRVERSADAQIFSPIATISAYGTGGAYQRSDEHPLAGMNYYRLAMIDQNGSVSFSAVRSIYFENAGLTGHISLFPNPAKDVLNINGLGAWSGATLTVTSIDGQLLQRTQLAGEDQISVLVGPWAAGMYWITIGDGQRSTQQSFIKQ